MKTYILFAIGLVSVSVLFYPSIFGQFRQPDKPEKPGEIISIDCPESVPTEISGKLPGWSVTNGPSAKEYFTSADIHDEGGRASIGCLYGKKGEYAAFVLSRKMPPGYVCKVENKTVHPRSVTCRLRVGQMKN